MIIYQNAVMCLYGILFNIITVVLTPYWILYLNAELSGHRQD
jgi:hypothetical protein